MHCIALIHCGMNYSPKLRITSTTIPSFFRGQPLKYANMSEFRIRSQSCVLNCALSRFWQLGKREEITSIISQRVGQDWSVIKANRARWVNSACLTVTELNFTLHLQCESFNSFTLLKEIYIFEFVGDFTQILSFLRRKSFVFVTIFWFFFGTISIDFWSNFDWFSVQLSWFLVDFGSVWFLFPLNFQFFALIQHSPIFPPSQFSRNFLILGIK